MSETSRYIATNPYWEHIFDEDQGAVLTEWIFDTETEKLVGAMIADKSSLNFANWHKASPDELADLEDSIKNANEDCIDNPEDWDLIQTNELPMLGKIQDQSQKMTM